MNLCTFFEKFELFAEASKAAEKLQQLVLSLAVRGKLVPQNPKDEPAEVLIKRVSAALLKKKSENPFLSDIAASIIEESDYDLPCGWAWLPLGHLGIWATGCGFPTQYQGRSDQEFLFCKVSDMNLPGNEVEIHATVHTIDAVVLRKLQARANPAGTVIFPKIGGAIATHKRRLVIKPTIVDNNCSGIQPIGLTDNRWLLLFMRNLNLVKYQSGTSVPSVSQGALNPIRVGVPPLSEQKRIVAKVDELMALCDRLETQQKEREAQHAKLSRAALARFSDSPTPANLNFLFHKSYDASPKELRQALLTLVANGRLVHFKEAPILKSLGSLLVVPSANGVSNGPTDHDNETEVLRISAGTSRRDFYVDEEDYKYAKLTQDQINHFRLLPGDLLACRFNGNLHYVGRFSYYRGISNRVQVNPDKLIRFRLDLNDCIPRYVCLILNSKLIRDKIESFCATTAGNIGISGGNLKSVTILLPNVTTQKIVIERFEILTQAIDLLESEIHRRQSKERDILKGIIKDLVYA